MVRFILLYFLITTKNKDIHICPFFYKGCPLNMLILLFVVPVDLFIEILFFPLYPSTMQRYEKAVPMGNNF